MKEMLLGANAIAALVVALFFVRFWRNTRDRFFIFFSVAFLIDAIVRIALGLGHWSEDTEPFIYLGRLLSFGIIIAAIVDKNRK